MFLVGTGAGTDVFNGGGGSDRIEASAINAVIGMGSFGPANSIEEISAAGRAGVRIAGTTAADILNFSSTGLTGIVNINTGNGNDSVIGSAGADTILTGAGNDTLTGGAGDDFLNGGVGFDTFVFNAPGFGNDTIGGAASELFDAIGGTVATQDKIDLRGLGIADSAAFVAGIVVDGVDSVITIGADTIRVAGVIGLDATDFIFS